APPRLDLHHLVAADADLPEDHREDGLAGLAAAASPQTRDVGHNLSRSLVVSGARHLGERVQLALDAVAVGQILLVGVAVVDLIELADALKLALKPGTVCCRVIGRLLPPE